MACLEESSGLLAQAREPIAPAMADPLVDYLHRCVAAQQVDIRRLHKALHVCVEDVATLRDCLADAGLLRPELFLAKLHRRSFAAARAVHWFMPDVRFDDALHIDRIALAVSLYCGPGCLWSLGQVSKAINSASGLIWPTLKDLCPGHIYVCGGGPDDRQSLTTAARFSPGTGLWEALPRMMERRAYAAAGILGGRLYICGGSSNGVEGPLLSSMERFNPGAGGALGTWEAMPPMSVAKKAASAAVVSGKLYVCGGVNDDMHTLAAVECFNPARMEWQATYPMLERRGYPVACAMHGRLYVCGGRDRGRLLNSAEVFDPFSGVWLEVPPMSERRAAAAAATMTGKVYVCGGWSGQQALNSAECFNPQFGLWESVPQMIVGRSFAAAVGATARLYVFGGFRGGSGLSSAEVFDPETGLWTALPSMAERRAGVVAAVALW